MATGYDVAVIGAGVFGAWTAYWLRRAGATVLLIDAFGPGNSRASSGGESRMIRLGYGPDEIYTRSSQRSLELWKQLFAEIGPHAVPLYQNTGILWLARARDAYCEAVLSTLETVGARFEKLDREEIGRRFPQIYPDQATWGVLEPDSGVLLARRAVPAVVLRAREIGVDYRQARVTPETQINADRSVFACGPWLPKIFPELLGELIHVTRQEVFFFGVPSGDERFGPDVLPAWIDFNDLVYGLPNLEGRGFKLAIDEHGPAFDPDTGERVVTAEGLTAARAYLARRIPLLADAPVLESRVCQYENTSNGDFLIDRHPELENVWIVGGGSGHGFKHGPAVGEYVAAMIGGSGTPEPRFSFATKQRMQKRTVY
jgi:glycine/D-amino acid oxidase-like deaminating enzyme